MSMDELRRVGTIEAIRRIFGKEPLDLPVTTTIREHKEFVKEFRLELSRRHPEMTNEQSDKVTWLAAKMFWPGIYNDFRDHFLPNEAADPRVRELAKQQRDEVDDRTT